MSKDKYLNRTLLKRRPASAISMDGGLFAQSVGLAGLAIDLARLEWQRDKTSKRPPSDFLDAAAGLVNEASLHAGTHTDEVLEAIAAKRMRERKATKVTWATLFDASSKPHLVSLEGGVSFLWKPIGTEKQQRAFLKKHWDRVKAEESERHTYEKRLKDGGVSPVVMKQFAVTRMEGNKLKGRGKRNLGAAVEGTAASASRREIVMGWANELKRQVEGTAASASRREKEQPKARKKQPRG